MENHWKILSSLDDPCSVSSRGAAVQSGASPTDVQADCVWRALERNAQIANAPAMTHAIAETQIGIWMPATWTGHPISARVSCTRASSEKNTPDTVS